MTPDLLHGFRVGLWTVEPRLGVITDPDGRSRHLEPKVMDVLVCLAAHPEKPVLRDAILGDVWGERAVSDEPLTRVIGELRRALDDDARHPEYIETIPKRGYRLLVSPEPLKATPAQGVAILGRGAPGSRLRVRATAIILIVLSLLGITAGVLIREVPQPPAETSDVVIAVMPFGVCEYAPRDEMLALSISDEVINRLSARGTLKVIARSSVEAIAGFELSVLDIAASLGAQYLLAGDVCRSGSNPTLTAELLDSRGFIVWSDTFAQGVNEFGTVTNRLASQVANEVAAKLGDVMAVQPDVPVNGRAYEQLLIGRKFAEQRNWKEARTAIDRALEIEPDFAEAIFTSTLLELWERQRQGEHATLVLEETMQSLEASLALAEERIERGNRDFDAHFVAGSILAAMADWERELIWRWSVEMNENEIEDQKRNRIEHLARAEEHFRAAIEINSSDTDSYTQLFDVVEQQSLERRGEALEILEQGRRRDPFNSAYNRRVAFRVAARGRYDEAMEILDRFKSLPKVPNEIWFTQTEIQKNMQRFDDLGQTLIEMVTTDPAAFEIETGGPINGGFNWNNRIQVLEFVNALWSLGLEEQAEQWFVRVKGLPGIFWLGEQMLGWYLINTGRGDAILEANSRRFASMTDEDLISDSWFHRSSNHAVDLARLGQYERAIRLMEALQNHDFGGPQWAERAMHHKRRLAIYYELVGRDSEANILLVEIAEYLEREYRTGIRHPASLGLLARTYARQRRDDEALGMLKTAVDYGWNTDVRWVDTPLNQNWFTSPWTRLYGDPRFLAQKARMQADLNEQTERIRAMLADHDIDELLAPLVALGQDAVPEARLQRIGVEPLDSNPGNAPT